MTKVVNVKEKLKKDKKTSAKNKAQVKDKITKEKDLKYQYPKDTDDLASRKKFRTRARATRDQFLKKIAKAKGTEKSKLQKEAKTWGNGIFTKNAMPSF